MKTLLPVFSSISEVFCRKETLVSRDRVLSSPDTPVQYGFPQTTRTSVVFLFFFLIKKRVCLKAIDFPTKRKTDLN